MAILLLFPASALAQKGAVKETLITLALSGGDTSLLIDGKVNSCLSLPEGERVTVNCGGVSALVLKWYKKAVYRVTAVGASENDIDTSEYNNGILNQYIPLGGVVRTLIDLPYGGKLSDIVFLEGGAAPDTQVWDEPYDKADILVIAAHPDDEYLYMGGTIPYYGTERGLNVTVAWMTHQRRLRQDEALAALWAMGVHHYPEFVGFPDRWAGSYKDCTKEWGEEKTLGAIVGLFRKYRPEVVVTHDLGGEYGHGAHRVTAAMALKAAEAASDKTQFPETAETYGAWQIKKLYLHLYNENTLVMDWNAPLKAFEGKTALDMAKAGFSYHWSQRNRGYYVSDSYKYSCAKFGLAFTVVGPDSEKTDFLENIPAECLSSYVPPAPSPTAAPTAEPTPGPAKIIQLAGAPAEPSGGTATPPAVAVDAGTIAAAALIAIAALDICVTLKRKRYRHKKK